MSTQKDWFQITVRVLRPDTCMISLHLNMICRYHLHVNDVSLKWQTRQYVQEKHNGLPPASLWFSGLGSQVRSRGSFGTGAYASNISERKLTVSHVARDVTRQMKRSSLIWKRNISLHILSFTVLHLWFFSWIWLFQTIVITIGGDKIKIYHVFQWV